LKKKKNLAWTRKQTGFALKVEFLGTASVILLQCPSFILFFNLLLLASFSSNNVGLVWLVHMNLILYDCDFSLSVSGP
jgi:hypothetical protein